MGERGRKRKKTILMLTLLIVVFIYFFWENNHITVTTSEYINHKVPAAFDGFTIAQVSDLHNKTFGKEQKNILAKLKDASPDIIVVTGDLIDRRRYDLEPALTFVIGALKIAPVYYVTGNHEAWSSDFEADKEKLTSSGVVFMDDRALTLTIGTENIKILGVSDPDHLTSDYTDGNDVSKMTEELSKWSNDDDFKILLTHRPELFRLYHEHRMDLVFAGHAHGGQVRIPLVGGVIAPDQGFFPQYTSGRYTLDVTTMFVSRGLGNSLFPIRINDSPEIVVVKLGK